MEDAVGLHRGATLIPEHRLEAADLLQPGGKGPVELGPGAFSAVHIPGEAHYQLVHTVLFRKAGQLLRHHPLLPALDHRGVAGQQAGGIGDCHSGAGIAVIDGHNTQIYHSFSVPL